MPVLVTLVVLVVLVALVNFRVRQCPNCLDYKFLNHSDSSNRHSTKITPSNVEKSKNKGLPRVPLRDAKNETRKAKT